MPGIDINVILLVFVGLGAGVLSGFAGVGGAFIVTPALIILGFPAHLAVGTSLTWVVGKSIIAVIGHRKLGNVDMKLGLVLLVSAMGGMEVGVRMLNRIRNIGLSDEVVLDSDQALSLWELQPYVEAMIGLVPFRNVASHAQDVKTPWRMISQREVFYAFYLLSTMLDTWLGTERPVSGGAA